MLFKNLGGFVIPHLWWLFETIQRCHKLATWSARVIRNASWKFATLKEVWRSATLINFYASCATSDWLAFAKEFGKATPARSKLVLLCCFYYHRFVKTVCSIQWPRSLFMRGYFEHIPPPRVRSDGFGKLKRSDGFGKPNTLARSQNFFVVPIMASHANMEAIFSWSNVATFMGKCVWVHV